MKSFVSFGVGLGLLLSISALHSTVSRADEIRHSLFIVEPYPSGFDPASSTLSQMESDLPVREIKAAVSQSLFPLLLSMQTESADTLLKNRSVEELLLSAAEKLRVLLLESAVKVNNQLADSPQDLILAYLPWKYSAPDLTGTAGISLTGFKLGGEYFGKPPRFNERVLENIREIQSRENAKASGPVYVLGVIASIRLQKNKSSSKLQIILGMNPRSIPFKQSNPQVAFSKLVIPEPITPEESTVSLVTLNQELKEGVLPQADVQLGPLEGWNESEGAIAFQLLNDKKGNVYQCGARHRSAPYLEGTLQKEAHPTLGRFLKGKPVNFHIYELNLDLAKGRVGNLDLYLSAGLKFGQTRLLAGCVNNPSIDDQFRNEVNSTIDQQVKDAQNKAYERADAAQEQLLSTLLGRLEK